MTASARLRSTSSAGARPPKFGERSPLFSALTWKDYFSPYQVHVRAYSFTPECLCFIFKCADDYYRSPECQNRVEPVPEGLYLRAVIRPLYRFLRDQGYEVSDGVFVRRERDHDRIVGYDDVNQLFWCDRAPLSFFSISQHVGVHAQVPGGD